MFYLSLDTSEHELTLWKNPSISVNNPISLRKARSPAKTPGRLHRHSHGGRTEPSGWASQRPHQEPMTCQWPNDPMTKNYKDVWCFIYSNILWSLLHKSAWKHGWWPILLSKNPKSGFAGTTSPANTWFDPCRIGAECGVLKRVKEPRNFGAVACLDGYSNAMFFMIQFHSRPILTDSYPTSLLALHLSIYPIGFSMKTPPPESWFFIWGSKSVYAT